MSQKVRGHQPPESPPLLLIYRGGRLVCGPTDVQVEVDHEFMTLIK